MFPRFKTSIWILPVLCFQSGGCEAGTTAKEKILIPSGYLGGVRIDYAVKGAKPIVQQNGCKVYSIPTSGYLKTSSSPPSGSVEEELEYVKGEVETPISSDQMQDEGIGGSLDNNKPLSQRTFFLGTDEQYDLATRYDAPVGNLDGATFEAWRRGQDLSYKNLSRHNFLKANLRGANLLSANLKGANLQRVDLSFAALDANLSRANLKGALLYRANLYEALLVGADLRGCDLRQARLQAADLRGALLKDADMRGAEFDSQTKWPRGFNATLQGAVVKDLIRLQSAH